MFPGRRLRYEYYRVRNAAVARALGRPPLDITGSLRSILKTLRAGGQIAAAVDVPAYLSASSKVIPFLGEHARMPRGLFRLAVDQGVPVSVFITGFHFSDGRRFLRLYQIAPENNVDDLMAKVYGYLETLIREEPAAWHFWRISHCFFEPTHQK
jgi:lauroyl/myristoyl acyltransferase